jgi:hypothetical protein
MYEKTLRILSLKKFNDTGCNVVSSKASTRTKIRDAAIINNVCYSLLDFIHTRVLFVEDFIVAPFDSFFRGHHIPKSITGQQNELNIRRASNDFNIRVNCHSLINGL